jgi:hypothetical protein
MGGKWRPARKADNLTAICEPIVLKMWDPQRLTTLWASMAWYRDSFTFYLPLSELCICTLGFSRLLRAGMVIQLKS